MDEVDISDFKNSLQKAVDAAKRTVIKINAAFNKIHGPGKAKGDVMSFA